ncbi:CG9588 [Drosophila busckii]|uniref:26S proteasome non-ATPase regulatory subunit 9 n=1 Tax=Drosophila busckii TaxID=30019 RepID=A0A0M3QX54_DROBS|nr:CG9588 [Drosophila busckii]
MAAENTTKKRLEILMAAKKQLEDQISKNGQILATNDNVGMSGPLIDAEGYPRNDIDVYQVRQAHPELVNRASALELNSEREPGGAMITEPPLTRVIVIVNLVSPNSPAEEAGLRVGDKIMRFGSINGNNFQNNLAQIGEVVRHMQNQNVQLKVKRQEQLIDLILVPKTWTGRGLLGCNIVLPPEPMDF